MTNLEAAQVIANKIETHTQGEIEAMIRTVSLTAEIEYGKLYRYVGNLYMGIKKDDHIPLISDLPTVWTR